MVIGNFNITMVNGMTNIYLINIIQSSLILFGFILIFILPMTHILKGEKPIKFVFIIWFYVIIWALFFDGISPMIIGAILGGWMHGVVIVGFSMLLKKLIDGLKKYRNQAKS